ncbi:uncharacterized protein B0T15DRAFT_578106 [Chaetomium strumarium]|uniref:Uncharacterized protein n=1 Tax=Chaetomium strumarium TaxID=1170767 RepID=A0AAJ0GL00_9PEZI|nr:hypothetical protein B0T15DRAFT_578106 [Chaetomium strumarium]
MVFPRGQQSLGVVLRTCHEAPRSHLSPVYIVSGIRGILHGRIMAVPSLLPSYPGKEPCRAWTVMLDDPNGGIVNGEWGSVVVDRETNGVYGHIVGRGPLAHAYVVSLAHVLDQLNSCFGGAASTPTLSPPTGFRPRSQDPGDQYPSIAAPGSASVVTRGRNLGLQTTGPPVAPSFTPITIGEAAKLSSMRRLWDAVTP